MDPVQRIGPRFGREEVPPRVSDGDGDVEGLDVVERSEATSQDLDVSGRETCDLAGLGEVLSLWIHAHDMPAKCG